MEYKDDRNVIGVYVCRKIVLIDEVLTKLLQYGAVFCPTWHNATLSKQHVLPSATKLLQVRNYRTILMRRHTR